MPSKRPNLSFVPPLLHDQTLYSWEAVFHEMSGNATIDETRWQLCGAIRGGRHFHMPSHLDALCASTQLVIGTPEALVKAATIIPYYTQFCSNSVATSVLKRIRTKSSYGVAQALGIAATENHPHPPRRSCLQCIREDRAEYGFAYWRRSHQLPGVLVCQKHRMRLLSLPYDHNSICKGKILWPDEDWNLANNAVGLDWSDDTLSTLHRLAVLAAEMVNGALEGGYALHKIKGACMPVLHSRNLMASDGSLEIPPAIHDYYNHFASVAAIPEMVGAARGSIRPVLVALGHTNYRTHPIEWMLVIDWLFGDWKTFQSCLRE